MNEIGRKLKELRVNRLMSITQLSKQIGISKNSICRLENGRTTPKWVTLAAYKKFFGAEYDKIKIKK